MTREDKLEQKLAHAKYYLKLHVDKLLLATTSIKKWDKKAGYYEKRLKELREKRQIAHKRAKRGIEFE